MITYVKRGLSLVGFLTAFRRFVALVKFAVYKLIPTLFAYSFAKETQCSMSKAGSVSTGFSSSGSSVWGGGVISGSGSLLSGSSGTFGFTSTTGSCTGLSASSGRLAGCAVCPISGIACICSAMPCFPPLAEFSSRVQNPAVVQALFQPLVFLLRQALRIRESFDYDSPKKKTAAAYLLSARHCCSPSAQAGSES